MAVRILDGHGVPDVQGPGLDAADLGPVRVLDVEGVAEPQGLAVDPEGALAAVVLDPVVVADRDHLLADLVVHGGASRTERLTVLPTVLSPVPQSHDRSDPRRRRPPDPGGRGVDRRRVRWPGPHPDRVRSGPPGRPTLGWQHDDGSDRWTLRLSRAGRRCGEPCCRWRSRSSSAASPART